MDRAPDGSPSPPVPEPVRSDGALFDRDPARYARARPGYPAELVTTLIREGGLRPGARALEIGPGTGQATRSLLAAGLDVTAVEPGAGLAAELRRACPQAEVVVTPFEAFAAPGPGPRAGFDLVAAFTSWHWLDPEVRTTRAAAVLRPGGVLATVTTSHVAGGSTDFFSRAQTCYERWDPRTEPGLRLLPADDLPPVTDEVDSAAAFGPAARHRFVQDVAYTTASYLDVIATYSPVLSLGAQRRAGLLACLADLLERDFGGRIVKRYLYELRISRREQG